MIVSLTQAHRYFRWITHTVRMLATSACYIREHNHITLWRGEGANVGKAYNGEAIEGVDNA